VRGDPRLHWNKAGLEMDGANAVATGSIELTPDDLDPSLCGQGRLHARVIGRSGPGLILRVIPVDRTGSARVSPEDAAVLRSPADAGPATVARLEVAAPTWWTTLRALPGPSTSLAVATLVTALLLAAPLVFGGPSDPGRAAAAALVEVQRVDDDLAALPELSRRLDAAVADVPAGPGRTEAVRAGRALKASADRLAGWEDELAARASRAPSGNPWDVAAKLSALLTAVLSFVVAYRALRPGG
jgi:hypothetical protein